MTNKEILRELKAIRIWAGDNLPASSGLTLVVKLEKLIKEIKKENQK